MLKREKKQKQPECTVPHWTYLTLLLMGDILVSWAEFGCGSSHVETGNSKMDI